MILLANITYTESGASIFDAWYLTPWAYGHSPRGCGAASRRILVVLDKKRRSDLFEYNFFTGEVLNKIALFLYS
jgi:hypothetical protein